LINGIPITNPDLAPPDLNMIPLQEIKAIEIIAGSESVLYGDQAVGGIINIITEQDTKNKFSVSASGGSYDQHNFSALLAHRWQQLGMNIGVINRHNDNYRDHNTYDQNLLIGNFDFLYATGDIAFDYQVAKENMEYPGALTAAQVAQNRRQASNDTDFFNDWNGAYHLHFLQQLNSDWKIVSDLSRREMHGNGILMSGLEDDRYRLQSLFGITPDTQQKYGIFTLAKIPYRDFLMTIGARGAQQDSDLQSTSKINRAFASTLGIEYQINSSAKLFARRADNFRFPKADENASTPPGVNGLRTQRGVSYETGGLWIWRNFTTKISAYQLNLRDEIMFDPLQTPQNPFGSNQNLAPTVRRGMTASEKYQVTDTLALSGQYNYVNARFSSGLYSGNRIPLVAENIFHGGVDYHFLPHWNLFSEAIYTGSQFAANDNANTAGHIGGYTLFNMNLRFNYQQFSAAFHVNNIFNKNYYFYTVFQPFMNSVFYYPAPGRNFLLTLKYDFV
jgi:iron complex outermembrane recepter protein